jgi:uncharacterized protein (DUF1330 family)
MAAYVIVDAEPTNPEGYREYQRQVPATLEPYGGRFLVRGGEMQTLEGQPPRRMVVLEFPSLEQANAWYGSAEYQAILPLRQQHGRTGFMVAVPGV